ncbi:MAG: hypothetical protein AAFY64_09770 [Pseudomonadota bacterium]
MSAPDSVTATIALEQPMLPNIERIIARIGAELGVCPKTAFEASDRTLILPISGGVLTIGLVDTPVAHAKWERLAARATTWPEARASYGRHIAQLNVQTSYAEGYLDAAVRRHAKVIAEILSQVPAVAVLWGHDLVDANAFRVDFTPSAVEPSGVRGGETSTARRGLFGWFRR